MGLEAGAARTVPGGLFRRHKTQKGNLGGLPSFLCVRSATAQEGQERHGVVGGDERGAFFDTFPDIGLGVGAVHMHREALGGVEGEEFGSDQAHRQSEFVIIAVGIRLEFGHLEVGITHGAAAVDRFDVLEDPCVESIEPAGVKIIVFPQKGHGFVHRLLAVILDLHAQAQVAGAGIAHEGQRLAERGDALVFKFRAFHAPGGEFFQFRQGQSADACVHPGDAGGVAVMDEDRHAVCRQPDIKFNGVHAQFHGGAVRSQGIFGIFGGIAAVSLCQNVFHFFLLSDVRWKGKACKKPPDG